MTALPHVERVSDESFYQDVILGHEDSAASIEANPETWKPVVAGVKKFAESFAEIQLALEAGRERDGRPPRDHEVYLLKQMIGRALSEAFPEAMSQHEDKLERMKDAVSEVVKATVVEREEKVKIARYERWATELAAKRRAGFATLVARAEQAGETGIVIDSPGQLSDDEKLVFQNPTGFQGFSDFSWPQLGRTRMFLVKASRGLMYAEELPIIFDVDGKRLPLNDRVRDRSSVHWQLPAEVRVHERSKQRAAWDALEKRLEAGEVIRYTNNDAIPPAELAAFLDDDYSERAWFLNVVSPERPVKLTLHDGELASVVFDEDGRVDSFYIIPRP